MVIKAGAAARRALAQAAERRARGREACVGGHAAARLCGRRGARVARAHARTTRAKLYNEFNRVIYSRTDDARVPTPARAAEPAAAPQPMLL